MGHTALRLSQYKPIPSRQRSRPYLFSNSLPPPVVASASKVFDLIMDDDRFYKRISANTTRFRESMTRAGFEIAGEDHPICPVMLYDEPLAVEFAAQGGNSMQLYIVMKIIIKRYS